MSSIPRVGVWPLALLLDGLVCECLAAGMLTIPDCYRLAFGETNHIMFPIDFSQESSG